MKQHMQFCVYKITNTISNKSYIGKTKDLENRWKSHLNTAKFNKSNSKFPNALKKYPEDTWDVSILYETDDENHCYEVEEILVDEYDTFKSGYNSCGGGIGSGSGENSSRFGKKSSWSQEQKDAISGENNTNFGKKWSQERKDERSGENHPMYGRTKENHPVFGKRWTWSQEQKDERSGENHPRYGFMPWEHPTCKSTRVYINWFYLDKVYELRTKYKYGQKKIYDILIKDYPNIKKSLTSFQSMFKWIEKNGNPLEHKEWVDFHNNL